MRKLVVLLPFLLLGCASKTAEEQEAAKYPPQKMMSEEQAKADQTARPDPRTNGAFHPQGEHANPGGSPVGGP